MRNIFTCFILIIFGFFCISEKTFSADLQIQISEDYKNGKISYHQYLVYQGYLIFSPEKIYDVYPGIKIENAIKSGTGIILELMENWDILTEGEKSFFSQFIQQRPTGLDKSIISPSGYFKVHYTTRTGNINKIPSADLNENDVPDYAEETALALDKSRSLYVDTLGFLPPVSDGGIDGPEFDIYLKDLATIYGQTFFPPNVFIEVDNDFKEEIYNTKGVNALKVTCAHELHHAVQFSYIIRSQDFFFYEATSTLMEDMVFDEINDYYQYLPKLFKSTQTPFNTKDGFHEYGLSIWGHFLNKKYDRFIMRKIWDKFKRNIPVLNAIDETLMEKGNTFADDLNEFYIWNFFTGSRADEVNYYNDGSDYPEIERINYVSVTKDTVISISNKYLTPNYILLEGLIPTSYEINAKTIDKVSIELWRNKMILFEKLNPSIPVFFKNADSLTNTAEFMNQGIDSKALIVSTSVARTNNSAPYSQGDYNMNVEVKIKNIDYKVNRIREIYPNPFIYGEHNSLSIAFSLEKTMDVRFLIISSSGRIVKIIERKNMSEGLHPVTWNGLNEDNVPVPSGIYLVQFRTDDSSETKKIAIIRK